MHRGRQSSLGNDLKSHYTAVRAAVWRSWRRTRETALLESFSINDSFYLSADKGDLDRWWQVLCKARLSSAKKDPMNKTYRTILRNGSLVLLYAREDIEHDRKIKTNCLAMTSWPLPSALLQIAVSRSTSVDQATHRRCRSNSNRTQFPFTSIQTLVSYKAFLKVMQRHVVKIASTNHPRVLIQPYQPWSLRGAARSYPSLTLFPVLFALLKRLLSTRTCDRLSLSQILYMMDSAEDCGFRLMTLPLELRYAVYQHILSNELRRVVVVSNFLDGWPSPTCLKFYTVYDLSLLEVNKQIRVEASRVFYAENVFVLKSYHRSQEHGQRPLYGEKCFQVDYGRIHKAHILTPHHDFPTSHVSCEIGKRRMRTFLEGIADVLAGSHCMRYLLIESYEFERAVFDRADIMACELADILEPLEKVRGVQSCHIRAMRITHWPYLRFLEREIMKSHDDPPQLMDCERLVREMALMCKKALRSVDIANAFGDPDLPHPNKIFEVFGVDCLYEDVGFRDIYPEENLGWL